MTLRAFRRLRKRVLKATGGAKTILLRRYLREKARRGKWDKRYFAYNNIDSNVTPRLKRAAMRAYAIGLVPTSSTSGGHSPNSWHFQKDEQGRGRAVDFGNRRELIGTAKGRERMVRFQRSEFARGGGFWVEVIGPDNNMIILNHHHSPLSEGTILENMHDTHVHIADSS